MNRQAREFISTIAIFGLAVEVLTILAFGMACLCGSSLAAYTSMRFHLPGMVLMDASQLHLLTRGEMGWWVWVLLLLLTGWAQWCVIIAVPCLLTREVYASERDG